MIHNTKVRAYREIVSVISAETQDRNDHGFVVWTGRIFGGHQLWVKTRKGVRVGDAFCGFEFLSRTQQESCIDVAVESTC